ncbi:O-antigen ligase family protein [Fictibacillus phosphorivorans]|uniref:O-antigen ligase family protein n=1 Tax=Fictibacillus phosphorivorans TaxID=1221500 RepID=UPI0035EF75FC
MKVNIKEFSFLLAAFLLTALCLIWTNNLLGLTVTALFAAYAFLRPKNGLLLLIMYFPIRAFLIEVNPALKGIGDLIIIAIFLKVVFMNRKKFKSLFHFDFFEISFIIFCLIGAISAIITGVSPVAIVFQLRAFVIAFLLYYIVKRLDIKKEDIYKFLWVVVLTAIIICIQGLVEKISIRTVLLPEAWEQKRISPTNKDRIYGLIGNPNVLAVFLSISFLLTMILRSMVELKKIKHILFIILVLIAGTLELTYSRGTFLAITVGVIAYFILTRNIKKISLIAMTIILGTICIFYPANYLADSYSKKLEEANTGELQGEDDETPEPKEDKPNDRIAESFDEDTLSLSKKSGRLFVIDKGFQVFKDNPLIGTGFATFGDSATKSFSSPIYEEYGISRNIYSDNQYIQIIAQTGVTGVLIFASFLLSMLWMLWKFRKENKFTIPLIALLLATFVWGLFYNIWENKTFTVYYFILLGYLFNYNSYRRKSL